MHGDVRYAVVKVLGNRPVEELVKLVPQMVPMLQGRGWSVRSAAVTVLSKLPLGELMKLVPVLVPMLQDRGGSVQSAAVEVLGKLSVEELVKLVPLLAHFAGQLWECASCCTTNTEQTASDR